MMKNNIVYKIKKIIDSGQKTILNCVHNYVTKLWGKTRKFLFRNKLILSCTKGLVWCEYPDKWPLLLNFPANLTSCKNLVCSKKLPG